MFLGLIFSINDVRIYNSGDCVPYKDVSEWLNKKFKKSLLFIGTIVILPI
jgi:hypothetical protein